MKNRKYRVIAAALAAAAVLVTLLAQTVLAGDWKWNREKEKWWYLDDQNTYPVNGWEWIDGKCYRFDEEGYLYVDTVTPEGLTVNANGEWTVNGVVQEMETVLKENPPKQETVVVETAAETQPAATEPETKAAETTAAETQPADTSSDTPADTDHRSRNKACGDCRGEAGRQRRERPPGNALVLLRSPGDLEGQICLQDLGRQRCCPLQQGKSGSWRDPVHCDRLRNVPRDGLFPGLRRDPLSRLYPE